MIDASLRRRASVLGAVVAAVLLAPGLATAADVEVGTPGGEPEIAVNPKDSDNIVVGDNVYGISYSRDGGATWKHVAIPNIGDNTLAVQPDGTFLYTTINGTVWSSHDGGATWADVGNWVGAVAETAYTLFPNLPYPANVGGGDVIRQVACDTPDLGNAGFVDPDAQLPDAEQSGPGVSVLGCDRPWLVSDPNTGRAYLAFSDHHDPSGGTGGGGAPPEYASLACRGSNGASSANVQCGREYVSASGDGGHTWSTFKPMDTAAYPWAVTNGWSGGPAAAFGTLAAAYIATGKDCSPCIVFETSTDDGDHWAQHAVAPITFTPASSYTTSLNFEPYLAADPTRRGHYALMVFDKTQTHLLVSITSDSGATWKTATLAESGPGAGRWVPWIAYGSGGALGAMWLTTANDGSYEAWAAVAPRGDAHFDAPVRLSSAKSPGPVAPGGDDASDVTLTPTTLYAAWGDQRGGPAPAAWFGSNTNHVASYRFAGPACASRRTIRVHLRGLRGAHVHSLTVYVNERRIARRRTTAKTFVLNLTGRSRTTAHVRFVIKTTTGRQLVDRRTYHPCTHTKEG